MKKDEIFEEEEEKELSDENDIEENKNDDLSISGKIEEFEIEEDIKKSNERQRQIEKDSFKQDMLDEKQHLIEIFDDLKDNIKQNKSFLSRMFIKYYRILSKVIYIY